jgi:hypothetical protein
MELPNKKRLLLPYYEGKSFKSNQSFFKQAQLFITHTSNNSTTPGVFESDEDLKL